MNCLCFIFLLLTTVQISVQKSHEKCAFNDTVDLTNETPSEDGSYHYQGVVIPKENISTYNYHLQFGHKKKKGPTHTRGCLCNQNHGKYCVKLCCEVGQFFNDTSYHCEPLPQSIDGTVTNIQIKLPNDEYKQVNIFEQFLYQVGLPCERPEVIEEPDIPDAKQALSKVWDLLEDGHIFIYNENAQLDTVDYCITPYRYDERDPFILMSMSCPMKVDISGWLVLNSYSMLISILFFIPTIIVYVAFKKLRAVFRNKLLICYLISLVMAYAVISFINISHIRLDFITCSIMGYAGYYFFMSAFLWISVLCVESSNMFRENYYITHGQDHTNRFIGFSFYVWGLAGILTGMIVWSQNSDLVPERYKPGIGIEVCFLDTRKWSAIVYFYGPNLIILVFSLITFIRLIRRIYRIRDNLDGLSVKEKFFQEKALVILRLVFIMGICWLMDIISFCFRNFKNVDAVFALTDFCNAIQGVLIFVLFVLNRNVWSLLKNRYGTKVGTISATTMTNPSVY